MSLEVAPLEAPPLTSHTFPKPVIAQAGSERTAFTPWLTASRGRGCTTGLVDALNPANFSPTVIARAGALGFDKFSLASR